MIKIWNISHTELKTAKWQH